MADDDYGDGDAKVDGYFFYCACLAFFFALDEREKRILVEDVHSRFLRNCFFFDAFLY